MNEPTTVGYCRVSTTEQAEHGVSLDDQERRIREFCAERGWECGVVHRDRGISGSVPFATRPAGGLAFAAERIVVIAWDRLARDAADFLAVVRDREVVSVTEQGEPALLRDLRAVLAQEERRKIAERNSRAAVALYHEGRYNGPAPYGYAFGADSLLAPVPHEAEIVGSIFASYLAGENLSAIARDLNRRGVTTKRGGIWRQGTLSPLIRNPVYVGRLRCGEETAEGVHEAIIDPDTFGAVQQLAGVRTKRSKGRGRPASAGHLFGGGMLRCGECGEAMVPESRRRPKYRCGGKQHLGCQMPVAYRSDIDSAVYAYFEQVGLDVTATREAIAHNRDCKLREVSALLDEARRESQRSEERLARVRRDYTDGRLDADDWREFRSELGAEAEAARAEVARLDAQLTDVRSWASAVDAERETLKRLAEVRAAIIGEVRGAEGVAAVRAALAKLFTGFTLHRAGSESAPVRLHVELAAVPGFVIEPHIRATAIARDGAYLPVLARQPLEQAADGSGKKYREGVGYRYLLQPIPVGVEL